MTELITVNRFCANHSQLCSTFEIANSLPSSSPSTCCFSPLLQTVFSCVLCILFLAVLSMNLILQATFAVMFLWEITEKMWQVFCRGKRHQSARGAQFASQWHEARDQRGCTDCPAFWLYTNQVKDIVQHQLEKWIKMQTFGDFWWLGRPNSETKIITNFKENPKSKIWSQAWRCRISTAMNVSFVQGPGSNRHTTGITTGCQEAKYQSHNLNKLGANWSF